MNLMNFFDAFPNEQACRDYLKAKREEDGIVCPGCGNEKHYWIKSIEKWRCSKCRKCINLKAGTIMEKSKLPLKYWFMAIHLITATKKTFSCLELQRQLGIDRYNTVWSMMTKIRIAMGNRDNLYKLKGNIEIDDAFFEIVDIPKRDILGNKIVNKAERKRGRGSQKQLSVLVMVESNPVLKENIKTNKKDRIMGFVKMVVMDQLNSDGINYEVNKATKLESNLISDGFRGYMRLGDVVVSHKPMIVPQKEAHKKLPWVHTVIANAKRLFLGTHHSIGKEYLQLYLNEFCYKLNRRHIKDDMFDHLITASLIKP